jgi:hypothetical protein
MSRSLSPDLVWDRIRAVIETRHCLSERERRALRVRKVWRFGPRGYGEQTLVGFPSLFGVLDAAVYARAATINLTRSEVHQVKNFWGRAGLLGGTDQCLDGLHRPGYDGRRVPYAGLHGVLLSHWFDVIRHSDDGSNSGNVTDGRRKFLDGGLRS